MTYPFSSPSNQEAQHISQIVESIRHECEGMSRESESELDDEEGTGDKSDCEDTGGLLHLRG